MAAQGGQKGDVREIESQIGKLRQMPDDQRAVVTKQLALQIRALPAGEQKLGIAEGLANLSTEGDFGRDTLQAVTDALAMAVREHPMPDENGGPAYTYFHLAQLERYEGMRVNLDVPAYKAAKAKVDALEKERAAADFTLTDLTGKTWTRSSLKGKVVLVNFWATWCPPCRKEMPDLETLYQRFKDKGFIILAISDEKKDVVSPFIDQHHFSFPVLLDDGRKVNERYKVDGIPKSFIYNREGKLVATTIDMRTQHQFLGLLSRAGLK